jgi:hypothetical protein
MNDRNLVRGLFLMAISLAFGLTALRYPDRRFARAGPGLFPPHDQRPAAADRRDHRGPSRFVEHHPLDFNFKNIGVILASLCAFALVSHFVNMIAGIIVMVFIASFAGKAKYSVLRNLYISAGLCLVALAFLKLLGFNLPLY